MYFLSGASTILIYVLAAVLPAAILMFFIYKQDKVEKEPMGLLVKLILFGALAAIIAGIVEGLGMGLLDALLAPDSAAYIVFLAFIVVAVTEEGAKFLLLKKATWRNPHFNFKFDGTVYAVFVSLGFAALENILYVIGYGLSVAPTRALLAIPGHMSFAVFMGYYYGRARMFENAGLRREARSNLLSGYIVAVLFHGFYDTCALMGTEISLLVFFAFVLTMFVIVYRMIRSGSKSDQPI